MTNAVVACMPLNLDDSIIISESLAEKLAESAHLRPKDCHFIASNELRDLLKEKQECILRECGLRLVSTRYIRSARLAFDFTAYGKRYGVQILNLIDEMPAGLRLKGFKKQETLDPGAAGIEGRASVHDYEISGKGEINGPIDLLIGYHHRLAEHPLIKLDKIKLSLA